MDTIQIIKKIEDEIVLLHDPTYRKKQNVWAEEKQLKNMRKLLRRIDVKQKATVSSFCRVMYDSAATDSKIAKLSEALFEIAQNQ